MSIKKVLAVRKLYVFVSKKTSTTKDTSTQCTTEGTIYTVSLASTCC